MSIETQIINQLVHSQPYAQSVFPYLEHTYFGEQGARILFTHIKVYVAEYNSFPSYTALELSLDAAKLEETAYNAAKQTLAEAKEPRPVDLAWMIDTTEKYVKERALTNAIRQSISIIDDEKRNNGEISQLVQDALLVSFDNSIGHDYFEDAEKRYTLTHSDTYKVPFSLDILNQATKGGVEPKTCNVFMAGCVHPHTQVKIQYTYQDVTRTVEIKIGDLPHYLDEYSDIRIAAPALQLRAEMVEYVSVKEFVDKGLYAEYQVSTERGQILRCNEDHLVYSLLNGWMTAKELAALTSSAFQSIHILTDKGWCKASCKPTGFVIPIVDVVIEHDNHAYYANGIASHNTNVGKSLILCNEATFHLQAGRNVLYITMEMAEEKIANRIDANMINVSLDDFEDMPREWFLKALEKAKAKTTGRLKIKEYPSNQAHVGHFRHLLQELELKQGFKPDVIIVDYLNICASAVKPSSVPRHQYVQSIAEELRGLSQEKGPPILTATQTNREGFDASDASITHTSEAWGVPLTVDWFLIVSQPEELAKLGQFACKQEKSRYSDKNKMRKFIIGVDTMKQRIFDVDQQGTLHTPDAQHQTSKPRSFFETEN